MMPSLHLAAVARRLGAVYADAPHAVTGLCIDTRRLRPGELFVAIPGERVDGHDFLEQAAAAGAVAALVERPVVASIPCLQVDNTRDALTELGRANREAYAGEVLAITGSCGKTSVKNLCRAIFSRIAGTVATEGNYNNELGVPLTLGRIDANTRFAVIEMGATGRGDIAHLCGLARPRVSTVLNAMEAHLDGFGSVADVADIKAEIYDGLGAAGVGVVMLDPTYGELWRRRVAASGAALLTCSIEGAADVCATAIEDRGLEGTWFQLDVGGKTAEVTLPLPGRHNVKNALVAAGLAVACDIRLPQIAEGLARAEGEPGRLQRLPLGDTTLVDDSYNANPGSVRAAIALLAATPGRRVLVLGEMLELGHQGPALHREMGELARRRGIDGLWGVGAALAPAVQAFGEGGRLFPGREALVAVADELLDSADVILVKGSRGAAMERVVNALVQAAGEVA